MPLMRDRGSWLRLVYDIFEVLQWYAEYAPKRKVEYVTYEEYEQPRTMLVAEGHTLISASEWLEKQWAE
jgi:hypothetical protein